MLEQLHFILGGWDVEGTQDSDQIVALKKKKIFISTVGNNINKTIV